MSCQNRSQVEKEYIKNLEEKNRILEKELQESKGKSEPVSNSQKKKQESTNVKDYFTIGSSEQEVIGTPTKLVDLDVLGKRFYFGLCLVVFHKDKVTSYDNLDQNLKVKLQ